MHRQAHEVLPALLESLGVDSVVDRPWLFGHSDGGSIALLYSASFPDRVSGCIVLAPHIFVEGLTIQGLKRARQAYLESDVRQRLARHHDDPDSVFWGWSHIWLHPLFKSWNIEPDISPIRCPVLAVQGLDDEYGSLEQIRGIARLVPHSRLLELPDCGHSPHREQPERVIDASMRFMMLMQ
jgi:pimeloyl-ACP methyl ester carboxylesterase